MNKLFFGDNLEVLKSGSIKDESVDLVYLDPPFKSNATYNVLFKDRAGMPSESQAEAFRDTWSWGDSARNDYDDILRENGDLALVLSGLRAWLGENSMMAYLAMMAARLIHLRRIMKPSASIYLHCDPTASHYLKILLDALFGPKQFRNEVIWDYSFRLMDLPHFYNRKHDDILFYAKDDDNFFDMPKTEWTREDIIKTRKQKIHVDADGVEWIWMPGGRGHSKNKLRRVDEIIAGGKAISDVWPIPIISSSSKERVHYPTQKPRVLLERIISASCPSGGTVLDPFCGCGTAVDAAEELERQWIGIDVTHYAVTLIERRLARWQPAAKYKVEGRPIDLAGARDLFRRDPHQFQWWAAWRLGAQSYRETKRGADRGIDGNIFFANGPYGTGRIIISVKGGENIGPAFVRELVGTVENESATMGVLITLADPTKAMVSAAAAAGFVSKSAHGRLPRVQIATVEDMLGGRMPTLPPIPEPPRGAAPRPKRSTKQMELLLPIEGQNIKPQKGDFIDPRFADFG